MCNGGGQRRFGRAQIEAGINEQTYLLHEWHGTLINAGFRLRTTRVGESFAAIYEKAYGGDPDVFAGFYEGRLTVVDAPGEVDAGSIFPVTISVENRGNAVWTSVSQFPVHASFHLSRRNGDSDVLQSFDNARTPLPSEIGPGQRATIAVTVTAAWEPGEYVAEIDLVHESVRWFASKGLGYHPVRFRVSAP